MPHWLAIVVDCQTCHKRSNVVLGTKSKEEKPLAKCPLCQAATITIVSMTPKEAPKS
jgi:hypothetical protein